MTQETASVNTLECVKNEWQEEEEGGEEERRRGGEEEGGGGSVIIDMTKITMITCTLHK